MVSWWNVKLPWLRNWLEKCMEKMDKGVSWWVKYLKPRIYKRLRNDCSSKAEELEDEAALQSRSIASGCDH